MGKFNDEENSLSAKKGRRRNKTWEKIGWKSLLHVNYATMKKETIQSPLIQLKKKNNSVKKI